MYHPLIEQFISQIGSRPRSWQGKDLLGKPGFEFPRWRDKEDALRYPLISHSNPACICGIAVDVDHPETRSLWSDLNLPAPNLIMINPKTGHGHYWFQFTKPVYRHRKETLNRFGASKAWKFYEAIKRALTVAYMGDLSFNGEMLKNPTHAQWVTIVGRSEPYEMSELYAVPQIKSGMKRTKVNLFEDDRGRNCTIYRSGLSWAVRNRSRYETEESFVQAVVGSVRTIWQTYQHPSGRLPESELSHICKSIIKTALSGKLNPESYKNRGVAQVDVSLSVREKQQEGQTYTSTIRRDRTIKALYDAYIGAINERIRITKAMVARRASVSLSSAYRHWKTMMGFIVMGEEPKTVAPRIPAVLLNTASWSYKGDSYGDAEIQQDSYEEEYQGGGMEHNLKHPVTGIVPPSPLHPPVGHTFEIFRAILRGEITRLADIPPEWDD